MSYPSPKAEADVIEYDLKSSETLRALFARYSAEPPNSGYRQWQSRLVEFLEWVGKASPSDRATIEFQQKLWDDNPITSVGRGAIPVGNAIQDSAFREWLATASVLDPTNTHEALSRFSDVYQTLLDKLQPHCAKLPKLKVFRVLASFFPRHFTTLSDRSVLMRLYKGMFDDTGGSSIARHLGIVRRLQDVLGPMPADLPGIVQRMTFPWFLVVQMDSEEDQPVVPGSGIPGGETLSPLPAVRRRKGLTGKGNVALVMNALEYVREGVTRDEFLSYLRSQEPSKKDVSLRSFINSVLRQELHVIRLNGDQYVLTPTGESFLESEDPSVLAPWLLTRILGVDHALVALRKEGSQPREVLVASVKKANPGWTTRWVPKAIVDWLLALGFVTIDPDKRVALTEFGQEWAARIHWTPENLPADNETITIETADEPEEPPETLTLPSFEQIYKHICAGPGHFDREFVATLHAGIWAPARRHFAIMTGLSGAGKTMLGIRYAKALTAGGTAHDQRERLCIVPVQPGWSDPSSLLGYVNPLRPDTYVRMPFLDFLLSSGEDPAHPYVVILDEMNLSHPEQYLAPLLSAMETGGYIELHREDDVFDGVPSRIVYPANLSIIGTVNMDETTHGLSDKVLDRAFTLEFWNIDLDDYPKWHTREIPHDIEASVRSILKALVDALAPARLHFGWRVIDDVLDFMVRALESGLAPKSALDSVIYAKILPKLRGEDSLRFQKALDDCLTALRSHEMKTSADRVQVLRNDLSALGTARFWR